MLNCTLQIIMLHIVSACPERLEFFSLLPQESPNWVLYKYVSDLLKLTLICVILCEKIRNIMSGPALAPTRIILLVDLWVVYQIFQRKRTLRNGLFKRKGYRGANSVMHWRYPLFVTINVTFIPRSSIKLFLLLVLLALWVDER